MPKVYNMYRKNAPSDAVNVGRGSPYGNPVTMGRHGDRDTVCDKYEKYLLANTSLLARVKAELKGRDLVCICAPKRCHGDLLLKIANEVEK